MNIPANPYQLYDNKDSSLWCRSIYHSGSTVYLEQMILLVLLTEHKSTEALSHPEKIKFLIFWVFLLHSLSHNYLLEKVKILTLDILKISTEVQKDQNFIDFITRLKKGKKMKSIYFVSWRAILLIRRMWRSEVSIIC